MSDAESSQMHVQGCFLLCPHILEGHRSVALVHVLALVVCAVGPALPISWDQLYSNGLSAVGVQLPGCC